MRMELLINRFSIMLFMSLFQIHSIADGTSSKYETETISKEISPAGPTTRRDWFKSNELLPTKIQYEYLRTGALIVGGARVFYVDGSGWKIITSDKREINLNISDLKHVRAGSSFIEGHVRWYARVVGQHIPVEQPGLPTESEPALDLIIYR